MIARVVLTAALASAACSRDIKLGDNTDAAVTDVADASSPFTAGAYTITFLDPSEVQCGGTLTGHEASFTGLTRADLALVDGTVELAPTSTQLTITGTPIQSGVGQSSVVLSEDTGSDPPTLWDVSVAATGTGPESTHVEMIAFAVDSATAGSASGIEGACARLYVTADDMGSCSVAFRALLVMN